MVFLTILFKKKSLNLPIELFQLQQQAVILTSSFIGKINASNNLKIAEERIMVSLINRHLLRDIFKSCWKSIKLRRELRNLERNYGQLAMKSLV